LGLAGARQWPMSGQEPDHDWRPNPEKISSRFRLLVDYENWMRDRWVRSINREMTGRRR